MSGLVNGSYYQTIQGDTWDMIAYKVYGDEMLLYRLIDYNPDYAHIHIFDSGYYIEVPPINMDDDTGDDVGGRDSLWA